MSDIATFLEQFAFLPKDQIALFVGMSTPMTIEKDAFFAVEGETARKVAFVHQGVFRSFYRSGRGEEVTYCFRFGGELMTAYSSWIRQQPSAEYIQALTPASISVLSFEQWNGLLDQHPAWLRLARDLAEQQYLELEQHIWLLQKERAELRYAALLARHPQYVLGLPLQYLASYLGISQRHLSRIRKQK